MFGLRGSDKFFQVVVNGENYISFKIFKIKLIENVKFHHWLHSALMIKKRG